MQMGGFEIQPVCVMLGYFNVVSMLGIILSTAGGGERKKKLSLNGSALKVAPTAFNGLQTRLDPWLPSVPILRIQMERNQPVWQSFCFDTEWVQWLHIRRFGIKRSEQKKENP